MADTPPQATPEQPSDEEIQQFLARLTPEQRAQLAAVSGAGAEAIAGAGGDQEEARTRANEAMSRAAKDQKLEISDATISKMVDELIERLSGLGAFDPQPGAGAAPAAEQPAPEVAAEAAAEVAAVQAPPRKLSWAERHFGDA